MNAVGRCLILLFVLRALLEALLGVALWPVLRIFAKERPRLSYQETPLNGRLANAVRHLGPWTPSPWAPWGTGQTVFAAVNRKASFSYSRSERVRMRDGVDVLLYWKETEAMPHDAPLVVVAHGIGGSSESGVSRCTTDMALVRGWRSVVYVRRGHGDASLLPSSARAPVTKGFPEHSDVDDMADVSAHVAAEFPQAPKALVGFSCGACGVVNYLGRHAHPFVAGVSVCNAHDLRKLADWLRSRSTMSAVLALSLQQLLARRRPEIPALCEGLGVRAVDVQRLMGTADVLEFEAGLMLPLCKRYSNLDEYYASNSCHAALRDVQVPMLTMASLDDPLIDPQLTRIPIVASQANKHVFSVTTRGGGHLGWLTGWLGRSWQQDVVFAFLGVVFGQGCAPGF
jgi:predicted alpha/beta-fold hydrolase